MSRVRPLLIASSICSIGLDAVQSNGAEGHLQKRGIPVWQHIEQDHALRQELHSLSDRVAIVFND